MAKLIRLWMNWGIEGWGRDWWAPSQPPPRINGKTTHWVGCFPFPQSFNGMLHPVRYITVTPNWIRFDPNGTNRQIWDFLRSVFFSYFRSSNWSSKVPVWKVILKVSDLSKCPIWCQSDPIRSLIGQIWHFLRSVFCSFWLTEPKWKENWSLKKLQICPICCQFGRIWGQIWDTC